MKTANSDQLWGQLQRLACQHSASLFRSGEGGFVDMPQTGRKRNHDQRSYICIDAEHKETVKILGSGDDEKVCARIHWYLAYYPSFFNRA